jgi:hypothetical protein
MSFWEAFDTAQAGVFEDDVGSCRHLNIAQRPPPLAALSGIVVTWKGTQSSPAACTAKVLQAIAAAEEEDLDCYHDHREHGCSPRGRHVAPSVLPTIVVVSRLTTVATPFALRGPALRVHPPSTFAVARTLVAGVDETISW